MKQLWQKYKEVILYLFFGGVTTVVSLVSFSAFNRLLGDGWYLVSNTISWILAVTVAYITNKLFVFESKSWAPQTLRRELPSFLGARVFSLVIEAAGLLLLIELLGFGEWEFTVLNFAVSGEDVSKFLMQVVVVVLNYVFSKLVIFKK